jgi:hypothetical protein
VAHVETEAMLSLLKDWGVPLFALALSIWFAASAKKDADRAQRVLEQIDAAVKGWQSQIMTSATNILDSLPQVIQGKINLAKMKAVESQVTAIRDFASNPSQLTEQEHEQRLIAMSAHLDMLLKSIQSNTP